MAKRKKLKKSGSNSDSRLLRVVAVLAVLAMISLIIAVVSIKSALSGIRGNSDSDTLIDGVTGTEPPADITTGGEVTTAADIPTDTTGVPQDQTTTAPAPGTEVTTEPSTEPPTPGTDGTTVTEDTNTGTEPVLTVETEKVSQNEGSATIVMIYPKVVSAGASSHSADELNIIIREYMDDRRRAERIESFGDEYEYIVEDVDLTYVGESFISAVVKGHYYIDGSTHPTLFAYTVNCDTKKGMIVTGADLIRDFARVRNTFTNGGFRLVFGMDGLFDETNYEDMIMEYRPEYDIYPDVYYTEKGFGLAIELVYTLGGYALFEAPLSSLGDAVLTPAG